MERAKAAFLEPVFIDFLKDRREEVLEHRKVLPQNACYTPAQALTLGQHAVASGIILLSAPGMRLRELDAVDRCIGEPGKRGCNIAKDPQWSLGKYFGIELLSLLVEFIGRRDYGDPAHQLVDFVAANTGSDRDKVVLA
jgi:hypothetical protein